MKLQRVGNGSLFCMYERNDYMATLKELIALGKTYADQNYREVGGTSNHQIFSDWVNSVGLDGCQNQPWCATFQFALELKIFGKQKALEHWHMTDKYVGSCVFDTRDKFPSKYRRNTPVLGALIIYNYSHMGRVIKIYSDGSYDSLEGNTTRIGDSRDGGYVAIKRRPANCQTVQCFCVIDYSENSSSTDSVSIRNYLQKGDNGSSVKTMQTMLIKCGFSCGTSGVDGQFGDATEKAVKNFQKKYGLTVDGKYGVNSKAKLESLYSEVNKTPSTPSANIVIKNGQIHANNFCGAKIVTDGMFGSETKKAAVKVLQTAMNLDYKSNLVIDGIWGNKSESALRGHYVKHGETQYMVTALQILLMLRGYDPNGVECPGSFGAGCKTAVHKYKADNKLSNDDIADYSTFKKLIS